jgi:integrase
LKYRFDGKQKGLAFGVYPDISLKDARERRDEARKLLAKGVDPAEQRRAQKAAKQEQAANTFEAVTGKWFAKWETEVTAGTAKDQRERLAKHITPILGNVPVAGIDARKVMDALRPLEARGTSDTLRKAKTAISMIMRFAIQHGWAQTDPVPNLKGAFKAAPEKHMAAITDPVEVGRLLRAIDAYQGQPEVMAALKMAPLVFVRIGELRRAKWADIDLDKAEWKYLVSKTRTEHLVPLSRQAVAILRELQLLTGHRDLVFPGLVSGKPISDATINRALQRMGYDTRTEMTGHGFRALARTLLAEELRFPPEIIEHQLAHRVPDVLGRAYNRTKFLKERKHMMQEWADYLDRLKAGASVLPFPERAA